MNCSILRLPFKGQYICFSEARTPISRYTVLVAIDIGECISEASQIKDGMRLYCECSSNRSVCTVFILIDYI